MWSIAVTVLIARSVQSEIETCRTVQQLLKKGGIEATLDPEAIVRFDLLFCPKELATGILITVLETIPMAQVQAALRSLRLGRGNVDIYACFKEDTLVSPRAQRFLKQLEPLQQRIKESFEARVRSLVYQLASWFIVVECEERPWGDFIHLRGYHPDLETCCEARDFYSGPVSLTLRPAHLTLFAHQLATAELEHDLVEYPPALLGEPLVENPELERVRCDWREMMFGPPPVDIGV